MQKKSENLVYKKVLLSKFIKKMGRVLMGSGAWGGGGGGAQSVSPICVCENRAILWAIFHEFIYPSVMGI